MDIDTKSIQVFLWKVLYVTMETLYSIVQAYPKSSIAIIIVLFLYVFLPLVLVILICSLVGSGIAVVVYRVYFRDDLEGFEYLTGYKKSDGKSSIFKENDMGKNVIVLGQNEKTRRRNVVNEKDRESYGKEIKEVNMHPGKKKAMRHSSHIVASPPFSSGHHEEGKHFSGVESSDDSEEEYEREGRNKVVEWSVDDQMNLSHVGNVEIERNTRLENLIARRRARKLLDIHVRNTLMRPSTNIDSRDRIPNILTARKNQFLSSNSELSPLPGSAPSVLLPMHKSPFDISFNPEEEMKPISTGDNFEKEILADQQKEATFCRHESFEHVKSLENGTIHDFSFHHGPHEKIEASRTRQHLESTQENEEDGNEVGKNQAVHQKSIERSKSSSSSEENLALSGANKDKLLKSLSSIAQKDTDSERDDIEHEIHVHVPYNTDRLLYEKTEGNSFFGEKRMCHAPSNSLASDLQVEVSEIGSPHSTSSNDKSNLFDDYINKEVTSGSEDMLADSSHISGVDMNETNTKEVSEVKEKDNIDEGFSSTNHNLDPNTSDLQPEKVVQQEEISSYSQPSNLTHIIQGQTTDVKPDHTTSFDTNDAPSKNDSEDSTNQVIAHTSTSENLKEASPEEVRVVDEFVVHNNDGNEVLKSREVIEPQAEADFSTLVPGINSESLEDSFNTSNKHSDLNTSSASDQKKSPLPVFDEIDPFVSQNMLTQDHEEDNVRNNNKSVAIENDAHTKTDHVKDSEIEATLSVKHVDLAEPSNLNDSKANEDNDENVKNVVDNDIAVDTSKAIEDIQNIVSDVKNKDLHEAELNKDISQHLAADGNDNTETIKSSQDANENVRKIVGDDSVVDTSKATEEIKNSDSDMKNKELQEVEPHKDVRQHLAADENDYTETLKASQDTNENVRKIGGDDNADDTSKATEEMKNIDSDMKIKELQEAEPHKDISQHLAADENDNKETMKVVESESRTSTPNETVHASKQNDLNNDLGKSTVQMEVKEQSKPPLENSTVEAKIISNAKETVNEAPEHKEIKPASDPPKKKRTWKLF